MENEQIGNETLSSTNSGAEELLHNQTEGGSETETKNKEKESCRNRKLGDNILILYIKAFLLILLGQMIGSFLISFCIGILSFVIPGIQDSGLVQTGGMYVIFIGIWMLALLCIGLSKNARPVLRMLLTKPKGNTPLMLLLGIVIGFGLNAFCILIAWLNKDIVLYFDSFRLLPLVIVFVAVFIQSSAEELICRGYLYQKLRKGYKSPIVAIVGNSLFFAVLHLGNEGVTVLSIINIFLTGILCSLIVYYMDSLWCAFAVHTAWNFTQNILFGLPNSGMVVPFSVFKLDASTATDSFAYNVGFGIEGTIVADVVLLLGCVVLFFWGRKFGKEPYNVWVQEEAA